MMAVLDLFPAAGLEARVIATAGARFRHEGVCFLSGSLLRRVLGGQGSPESLPGLCAAILGAPAGGASGTGAPEVLRVHLRCRQDRAEPWRGPGPGVGLCAVALLSRDNLILEEA